MLEKDKTDHIVPDEEKIPWRPRYATIIITQKKRIKNGLLFIFFPPIPGQGAPPFQKPFQTESATPSVEEERRVMPRR